MREAWKQSIVVSGLEHEDSFTLCMTGVAKDGESFLGCDGIRQVPAE